MNKTDCSSLFHQYDRLTVHNSIRVFPGRFDHEDMDRIIKASFSHRSWYPNDRFDHLISSVLLQLRIDDEMEGKMQKLQIRIGQRALLVWVMTPCWTIKKRSTITLCKTDITIRLTIQEQYCYRPLQQCDLEYSLPCLDFTATEFMFWTVYNGTPGKGSKVICDEKSLVDIFLREKGSLLETKLPTSCEDQRGAA